MKVITRVNRSLSTAMFAAVLALAGGGLAQAEEAAKEEVEADMTANEGLAAEAKPGEWVQATASIAPSHPKACDSVANKRKTVRRDECGSAACNLVRSTARTQLGHEVPSECANSILVSACTVGPNCPH